MTIEDPGAQRIRWWLVVLCTVAGAVAIWATFKIASRGSTKDVVVAFMVEIAAALFLLAIFFFLERGFTTRVTSTVVREVREQVVAPLEARVDAMATEIADIQGEIDQATREQTARHHDLVAALHRPTPASVAAALTEATRLRAIADGHVTVQANSDPSGIWMTFTYGAEFRGRDRLGDDHIRIELLPALPTTRAGRRIIADLWRRDEAVQQVAERLNDQLRQRGVRDDRNQPDWSIAMRNLQRSLDVALPVDGGRWHLLGALYELIGDDWAITEAGIERRDHGLVIAAAEFPRIPFSVGRAGDGEDAAGAPPWAPDKPLDVDDSEWNVVVDRGRARLSRPGYVLEPGSGLGWASENVPTWAPRGAQPNL